MITKFINDTGGNELFIWKLLPSFFAFLLIPVIVIAIKNRFKIFPLKTIIFVDLIYIIVGLSWFVVYTNNILLKMG
jgi:hypothetical protein